MLMSSIFAHIALGCTFALFFVIYYVNGDGKAKIFLELLLGLGGNVGGIFILYNTFKIDNTSINLISIAACLFSFLILTGILTLIFAFIIKDKKGREIIRLRDIILGQTSWIKEFRDSRIKEIDEKLNYEKLKEREKNISIKEENINEQQKFIDNEKIKLENSNNRNLKMNLPENSKITISKEYIEVMPSYFRDVVRCVSEMNSLEQQYLENNNMTLTNFKSYLYYLSNLISTNIFNSNSNDIRIHFRYYDKNRKGYEQLTVITGTKISNKPLTFIPYDTKNMIIKSFECKRALIKSINSSDDYRSDNSKVWQDYLTYTFYTLRSNDGIPYLSFGISVKNITRYKTLFYFLNYIKFEEYIQDKIESIHSKYNIEYILYGGDL